MRTTAQAPVEPPCDSEADDTAAARSIDRFVHGMGARVAAAAADHRAFAASRDPRLECEANDDQYERLNQNLPRPFADPIRQTFLSINRVQANRSTHQVPDVTGLFTSEARGKLGSQTAKPMRAMAGPDFCLIRERRIAATGSGARSVCRRGARAAELDMWSIDANLQRVETSRPPCGY